MEQVAPYKPVNKVRIVTAASLFDGHDAAINIMRRIIQSTGCEVIHLGHDRSVEEVVDCTKIVGACESIGDNYVLHFEKNADIKPFIHELGHIVFDALKTLGYEQKIIADFKNQYEFTNVDEYFVEKWMGLQKQSKACN
jgi:hypothetical protein